MFIYLLYFFRQQLKVMRGPRKISSRTNHANLRWAIKGLIEKKYSKPPNSSKFKSNFLFSEGIIIFWLFFVTATFVKNCIINKSYVIKMLQNHPSTKILNSNIWLCLLIRTSKNFLIWTNKKFQMCSMLHKFLLELKFKCYPPEKFPS